MARWAQWSLFIAAILLAPFERNARRYIVLFLRFEFVNLRFKFVHLLFKLGRLVRFRSKVGSKRNEFGFKISYFADKLADLVIFESKSCIKSANMCLK